MISVNTDKSVRAEQVALTHERILLGAVDVLRSGDSLTFARVATAAALPQRTVYRHFATAEDLERGAWQRVLAQFASDRHPEAFGEFAEHVREAFGRFSSDSGLVRAILRSREVGRLRKSDNAPRQAALRKLVDSEARDCNEEERARLAAVLRVLCSAPAWELLTDLVGLEAGEAASAVIYASQRMLGHASKRTRKKQRTKGRKG